MADWAAAVSAAVAAVGLVFGSGRLDSSTKELSFATAVLAGGEVRQWQRRIRFAYEDRDVTLHPAFAEISFTNIDGRQLTNQWPRVRPTNGGGH